MKFFEKLFNFLKEVRISLQFLGGEKEIKFNWKTYKDFLRYQIFCSSIAAMQIVSILSQFVNLILKSSVFLDMFFSLFAFIGLIAIWISFSGSLAPQLRGWYNFTHPENIPELTISNIEFKAISLRCLFLSLISTVIIIISICTFQTVMSFLYALSVCVIIHGIHYMYNIKAGGEQKAFELLAS